MKSAENKENTLKNETRSNSIVRSTFFEVFGDSKCHGVSNIIKNQNILMKIIWLLLFLAGICACIYCESYIKFRRIIKQ